jgi:hypothetical protein
MCFFENVLEDDNLDLLGKCDSIRNPFLNKLSLITQKNGNKLFCCALVVEKTRETVVEGLWTTV